MKYRRLLLLIAVAFLVGCAKEPSVVEDFNIVETLDDGIQIGEPGHVGIDPYPLITGVNAIRDGKYGEVHSVLIYKDGKLVVEEYFAGHKYQWDQPNFHGVLVYWDNYHRHNIMSAGKSFTSATVAIAIDKGFIKNVHDPIWVYLPEYQHLNIEGKDAITIEHLVTMTSGLEWDEWSSPYTTDANSIIDLWVNCEDQIACILSHDLVHKPGTHFTYSGGDMIVLGRIIQNATGMDIDDYMNQELLEPLGISRAEWPRFDSGIANTSGELYLTPREMLKFGVLYLNNGEWEGDQIVPPDWVELSRVPYSGKNSSWLNTFFWPIPGDDDTWGQRGYAYTWWTHRLRYGGHTLELFYASGFGGQQIFVIPDLDTVIVFTGGHYQQLIPNLKIIKHYFLPSVLD